MATLTLTVEVPEIVADLLVSALNESEKVDIVPHSIFPGYTGKVVSTQVTTP